MLQGCMDINVGDRFEYIGDVPSVLSLAADSPWTVETLPAHPGYGWGCRSAKTGVFTTMYGLRHGRNWRPLGPELTLPEGIRVGDMVKCLDEDIKQMSIREVVDKCQPGCTPVAPCFRAKCSAIEEVRIDGKMAYYEMKCAIDSVPSAPEQYAYPAPSFSGLGAMVCDMGPRIETRKVRK